MTEPLILIVTPRGKSGVFTGKIEGTGLSVQSKHPLVDTARALLLVGASPDTVLILRSANSPAVDRVRGKIGTILRKVAKKGPNHELRRRINE